jgi:hypothetical protein
MDKNELNDQIECMIGMAETIKTVLTKETLTSLDYLTVEEAAEGIKSMCQKAHNNQFGLK